MVAFFQTRVNSLVQRSSAHQQQIAAVESGKRELEQIRVQRAQLQADIDSTELQMSQEGNDISNKERERQIARSKQSSLEQQHRNMVDEVSCFFVAH
jgi:chromosome segregation ATPase